MIWRFDKKASQLFGVPHQGIQHDEVMGRNAYPHVGLPYTVYLNLLAKIGRKSSRAS